MPVSPRTVADITLGDGHAADAASLSWPQSPQRPHQEAVSEDAALEERIELVLRELRRSRGSDLWRSQAVHRVEIDLAGAYLWVPTSGGLPSGG